MLKIIAAVADNGIIGNSGNLPWRLPDDMGWFKDRTGKQPVVMGRKTFDSLPDRYRPLPGRKNIVLTHDRNHTSNHEDVVFIHDFNEVVEMAKEQDIFVMGGAGIYEMALPNAMEFYLTKVHGSPDGDTFFPEWNPEEWILGWEGHREPDEKHEYGRTWQVLFRDTPIYQFANTRTDEQRVAMLESLERNECPFCPEGLGTTHISPILWAGKHWVVTSNDYPYKGSKIHLLIIPTAHIEKISEIPPEAWLEYSSVVSWIEGRNGMEGGAISARSGNPLLSGSSIKHLHFHALSPELGKTLSFPVGCYKVSEISLP